MLNFQIKEESGQHLPLNTNGKCRIRVVGNIKYPLKGVTSSTEVVLSLRLNHRIKDKVFYPQVLPMDKATQWPYVIGVTLASYSSHQSQVLKLSTWRYLTLAIHYK